MRVPTSSAREGRSGCGRCVAVCGVVCVCVCTMYDVRCSVQCAMEWCMVCAVCQGKGGLVDQVRRRMGWRSSSGTEVD